MKTALISLSEAGAGLARHLAEHLEEAEIFLHKKIPDAFPGRRFRRVAELAAKIFRRYDGLIFVAPCGVAIRAVAPLVRDKRKDPAVVVVDAGGRFAVSLLGGHEGGANELALAVGNILGAEPVITTTTEALKTVIVGVGCRRGTEAEDIIRTVREALGRAEVAISEVRLLASAEVKTGEPGLRRAAELLGLPLRFIPDEEIRSSGRAFGRSAFVEEKVNLPAVAEPAALLAGRRTRFILRRIAGRGVTVALAREGSSWSASDRGDP